jgi:hypothetical protein
MLPKLRPLIVGAATFVPGVRQMLVGAKQMFGLGGAVSARYCYSVWLRHVTLLATHNLWRYPKTVAELGPGDSLGVGLCGLLTGSNAYYAFDVMQLANQRTNLKVLDELVELFNAQEPIPNDDEFPEVTPRLASYEFPSQIFSTTWLRNTLAPDRVAQIRDSLLTPGSPGSLIRYQPNWSALGDEKPQSMDLIISQAVLEHVNNLEETYRLLYAWLARGGGMSHAIDFRCHNMFREWNGHWTAPEFVWKLMRGRRVYLLNRVPYSGHVDLLRSSGFRVVGSMKYELPSSITQKDLAARFKTIDSADLTIGMATIQSEKELR